jgi:hypothetical protein
MSLQPDEMSSSAANQEHERIYAQTSSVGDRATADDSLGFDLYVKAISDFILAPNTRAPLTISIEGSWGSGKSSFMLQLKKQLLAQSPDIVAIDFNAWKYDKQEELWAAFALGVARSLRTQIPLRHRFLGDIRLYLFRIRGLREIITLIAKVIAWLLLVAAFAGGVYWSTHAKFDDRETVLRTVWSQKSQDAPKGTAVSQQNKKASPNDKLMFPDWVYGWVVISRWGTGALLLLGIIWKIPEKSRKSLFEMKLEEYIDKPDYKGRAAFVDTFAEDFGRTVRAYIPRKNAKVVVFIDDVDRCEPPKAADLMQAINLMIGDDGSLIFILGLDRAKVASAIAFKFRAMISYLNPQLSTVTDDGRRGPSNAELARKFGDDCLEKFIQLSFRIPQQTPKNRPVISLKN